jgi:hypothetical protein
VSVEYQPLSPTEIQALRIKAEQGLLEPIDCKRFIESTRAAFLSRPASVKASKAPTAAKKLPISKDVDFF